VDETGDHERANHDDEIIPVVFADAATTSTNEDQASVRRQCKERPDGLFRNWAP
jgi:hypothetical protein